ncbi:hypothetical protein T492DRAFT_905212 [Pavlovales sp. CCMP2436]|nr:hypothetical protein T492DRAFT_905212 [Pavlovales sp. CCMP2436]
MTTSWRMRAVLAILELSLAAGYASRPDGAARTATSMSAARGSTASAPEARGVQAGASAARDSGDVLADALGAARAQHADEVAAGRAAFPLPASLAPWRFDALSFASPFGTESGSSSGGVCATRLPLITSAECESLIAEASAAMAGGQTSRFTYTAGSRLGEVHASTLPCASRWLSRALPERFWPLLGQSFGRDPARLVAYDCLIVRYSATSGGVRQPVHRYVCKYL